MTAPSPFAVVRSTPLDGQECAEAARQARRMGTYRSTAGADRERPAICALSTLVTSVSRVAFPEP